MRTTAPATTTRAPSASPATTRPTGRVIDVTRAGLVFFATPSRRIQCLIVAAGGDAVEYVRCGITGASWKPPPKPARCHLDYEDVSLAVDGAGFVCAGDTVANPAGRVVAYGESIRSGRIICASSERMLRCTTGNPPRGFELSRERYRFF